jgi:hypothetical protein
MGLENSYLALVLLLASVQSGDAVQFNEIDGELLWALERRCLPW